MTNLFFVIWLGAFGAPEDMPHEATHMGTFSSMDECMVFANLNLEITLSNQEYMEQVAELNQKVEFVCNQPFPDYEA